MKLIIDQGLPRSAVEVLRAAGHDAVHVGDLGMSRARDDEILALALERAAVVVTLDA
jgi:predicted nuclease of predicted toxin-antitoxin system